MKLLIDSSYGIYICQIFAEMFADQLSQQQRENLSSPDNGHYFDTWVEIEDSKTFIDQNGKEFSLYMSGDLWAVYDVNSEEYKNIADC